MEKPISKVLSQTPTQTEIKPQWQIQDLLDKVGAPTCNLVHFMPKNA